MNELLSETDPDSQSWLETEARRSIQRLRWKS